MPKMRTDNMNPCSRSNFTLALRQRQPLAAAAALAVAAVGLLVSSAGFANPSGPQIVAGQVSILASGNRLLITNSPGAIINWQNFSINPGELTRFIQQNSSSSVLNRITGQDPSQILGALQSNGKVFLINPNGVLFGVGAQVNVSGLAASSLNLSNADFLAGKLDFTSAGKSGAIDNRGAITTPSGGQVYLIAPNVTNSGIITAPNGDVVLAAGHSVNLADSNDPNMRVVISAPGGQALNVGKVVAESGRIGIYGALVNQLGLVSADSAVAGENGKILLKASGDTLLGAGSVTTATGTGTGGEIQVLGDRVGLTADAMIDASGRTGGGTVMIGGDIHGGNSAIPDAALTYVGPLARIRADALESGDGGTVIVWSNQQTQMYGDISARGGAQGGDGGFAEISSKNFLDFRGSADLRAPLGASGTLLLDPSDITIASGPSSGDITLPSSAPFTITGSNPTSILSAADLQNELTLGNVTVSTSSSASAPLGGTISVTAPIAWGNANSLTLAANQGISINAPITAAAGTLVLTAAGGNITQIINPSTPAAIAVTALAASAPNGSVTLTEPTNNVTGAIAGAGGQGFSLRNSGAITVGTVATVSGISSSGGSVGLQAGNGIILNDSITVTAANGVVALQTANGDIIQNSGSISAASVSVAAPNGSVGLNDSTNSIGTIAGSANGASGFSLIDGNSFTVGSVSAVGTIASASGISSAGSSGIGVVLEAPTAGDITLSAPVSGGNAQALVYAPTGAIVQGSGGLITAGSLSITGNAGIGSSAAPLQINVGTLMSAGSQGSVYINDSAGLTVNSISALGAVYVNTGGSLTIPTALACDCTRSISGSSITLTAYGPMLLNAGSTITATNGVALYAGYDAASSTYVSSGGTLTAAGSVTGATIDLFAAGTINITGSMTGVLTQTPLQYSAAPPPPSLAQCIANPALAGCSAALPTVAQCTATPTTAGCSVVLPTLAQCTATPATAGCSVVLPTLAQCEATPTASGCGVVLPTLAQCTATPAIAGCSAVLPTLAQCEATPTTAGCGVVLPTLAQCAATPTMAGCTSVLPAAAIATTTPVAQVYSTVIVALNTTVNLIDSPGSATLAASKSDDSVGGKSDGGSGSATNENTSTKPGTTSDTAKKMYCN
jgi:filamentous hemagglutinin family protein